MSDGCGTLVMRRVLGSVKYDSKIKKTNDCPTLMNRITRDRFEYVPNYNSYFHPELSWNRYVQLHVFTFLCARACVRACVRARVLSYVEHIIRSYNFVFLRFCDLTR